MSNQTSTPHHRRSIRLPGYDYSEEGSYFITILIHKRQQLLGCIVGEKVELSQEGKIVFHVWNSLPNRFPQIELDTIVIMPNHLHFIITIHECETRKRTETDEVRAIHELPLPPPEQFSTDQPPSRLFRRKMILPLVVGYLKMNTAKQINGLHRTSGFPVWHRNYYEHIIGSDEEFETIAAYIESNPVNWGKSDEYFQ